MIAKTSAMTLLLRFRRDEWIIALPGCFNFPRTKEPEVVTVQIQILKLNFVKVSSASRLQKPARVCRKMKAPDPACRPDQGKSEAWEECRARCIINLPLPHQTFVQYRHDHPALEKCP